MSSVQLLFKSFCSSIYQVHMLEAMLLTSKADKFVKKKKKKTGLKKLATNNQSIILGKTHIDI